MYIYYFQAYLTMIFIGHLHSDQNFFDFGFFSDWATGTGTKNSVCLSLISMLNLVGVMWILWELKGV